MNTDFEFYHKNRVLSSIEHVIEEYSFGKRIFDKYDIENNYKDFSGLSLNNATFLQCSIEACFSNCDFKNTKFIECNLKTVKFVSCNLTNAIIDKCQIESINLTNSLKKGFKVGTNYAYGKTLFNEY